MLTLHKPTPDEWEYRQKLYRDVETTSHNAPYGDNGIDGVWYMSEEWLRNWIVSLETHEKSDYYAYILLDGEPIGEVTAMPRNNNLISIVIHAKHRGKGYGKLALKLLCDKVFYDLNYEYITDTFESDRIIADKIFTEVGFERPHKDDLLILRKERYFLMSEQKGV